MVERREHPRFALEASQPAGICGEDTRQNLERDVAPERRVARALHLAHAACPEQIEDDVRADGVADSHRTDCAGARVIARVVQATLLPRCLPRQIRFAYDRPRG
jgi:hypothetical protein